MIRERERESGRDSNSLKLNCYLVVALRFWPPLFKAKWMSHCRRRTPPYTALVGIKHTCH